MRLVQTETERRDAISALISLAGQCSEQRAAIMDYGKMCLGDLKKLLIARGAKTSGRKAELIARLEDYNRNANFGNEIAWENEEYLSLLVPCDKTFKDINADCPIPKLTKEHIREYLKRYKKPIGPAERMYKDGYLHYVRFSLEDEFYFVKGLCSAQMKKTVKYNVYCKMTMDGNICGACCECAAGKSSEAHCKHVVIVLFAVEQMAQKGKIIVTKTCTQQLQTFHQPKKRYSGSPVKLGINRVDESKDTVDDEVLSYRNYFRNLSIAYSFNCKMPLLQLVEPANPYAVARDHDYCKDSMETRFLKSLGLLDINNERIKRIEEATRDQRESDMWHSERKIRITASNFYQCCTISSSERGLKVAQDLLNPIQFSSNAISHGIIYEKIAIKKYEQRFDSHLTVQNCGLCIVESHPFLAASPDGLIAELTVLEVKCPFSIREDVISAHNLPYLSLDPNGNLYLRKNHQYYYQVQGQLLATGRQFCNFVIYTFKDMKQILIARDEEFIENMLSKLIDFYTKYFQPSLLEKHLYRNYNQYNFEQ